MGILVRFLIALILSAGVLTTESVLALKKKSEVAGKPLPAKTKTQLSKKCMVEVRIGDAIGPATLDFIQRAKKRAKEQDCGSILFLVNTPGGNLQTTRLIVEEILDSSVPVMCLIHPAGGHAGSAGAIILQACHISGGVTATNVGAATPISGGGQEMPKDLRKKMINDTRSWVEGLAKLRGRNEKFAKDIVEEAKAVSIEEAKKLGAVEFAGQNKNEFLQFVDGKKIKLNESQEVTIYIGDTVVVKKDLRYQVMNLLMSPQIAYMIFMGSLGLLYYELTHPGMIVPGVVGGIGLVISLISLHMLDVTWGAVLLILLGIAFMIAEAFVAGFGILGLGGIVSFFVGSLFLFDPATTGYSLPYTVILPTTILAGLAMIGIAYLAFTTRGKHKQGELNTFEGKEARVMKIKSSGKKGMVEISGELWKFKSDEVLKEKDLVLVVGSKGFTLKVRKQKES